MNERIDPEELLGILRFAAENVEKEPKLLLSEISFVLDILANHYLEFKPVADEFWDRLHKFEQGRVRTLDEAFDQVDKWKGVRLHDHRFWQDNSFEIYIEVEYLTRYAEPSLSQEEAFAETATHYPVGSSTIRDIYKWIREALDEHYREANEAVGYDYKARVIKAMYKNRFNK